MSKFIRQGNIKHIPAQFDSTPSKPVNIENLGGLSVGELLCNNAPVEATHVYWHKDWLPWKDKPQYYKNFDSKWYRLGNLGWCISIDHVHDDAWHREALLKLDDIRAAINDDKAVDHFAQLMKNKMAAARAKGRRGWQDKTQCNADLFAQMFAEHLYKDNSNNLIDLANLLMMLSFHFGDTSNIRNQLRQIAMRNLSDNQIENGLNPLRWIPVGERLPEDGERVLVFALPFICGGKHPINICERTQQEEDGRTWHLWEFGGVGREFYTDDCVTHWMPLPEAPAQGAGHD